MATDETVGEPARRVSSKTMSKNVMAACKNCPRAVAVVTAATSMDSRASAREKGFKKAVKIVAL
ncbi:MULTISPECIES: hypothetical protein [Paraburkholderia]|uniref:hypothetical protein n=1 Tax=Paraburkholderia TaxID=1822464 RepID=UPI001177F10E|nr:MULTISPECIES: hypothetical protein [Paraburkholderia]